MPKLSIIIPVYNVESFLNEAINSILSQTFQNYEILLINDGSIDRSRYICEGYASQDTRIRVFHQENQGVSAARNYGIDNAIGEYVTFLDPDDYLMTTDVYEKIFKVFTEDNDVDIVHFGFDREDKNHIYIPRVAGFFLRKEFYASFLPDFVGNQNSDYFKKFIMSPVVTLVIRRDILFNIRFCPIKRTEDKLFFFEVLLNAGKIYVFQELFYFYRMNMASATQNYNPYFLEEMIFSNNYIKNLLHKGSLFEMVEERFNNSILYQLYSGIINETYSPLAIKDVAKIERYVRDQNVSQILTWSKCFLLSKRNPLWVLIRCKFYYLFMRVHPYYRRIKK